MEKLYRDIDKINDPMSLQSIVIKTENIINQLNENELELKNDLENVIKYTNQRIIDLFKKIN